MFYSETTRVWNKYEDLLVLGMLEVLVMVEERVVFVGEIFERVD